MVYLIGVGGIWQCRVLEECQLLNSVSQRKELLLQADFPFTHDLVNDHLEFGYHVIINHLHCLILQQCISKHLVCHRQCFQTNVSLAIIGHCLDNITLSS